MVARKSNVVDAAFPLIGRDAELGALGGFFDEGLRLVTLLGPGGAGKTRLATAFAAAQIDAYSEHGGGGVWFCDLIPARDEADVCAIVATALGIPLEASSGGDVSTIGRALARRRRILLVLDNCEHVVAQVASLVAAWLAVAPHLHVLATSRIALGVRDEQLSPLGGLALPTHAVELFIRRARQVRPSLTLDDAELAVIGDIVQRLDGLPLAIELAAARTRMLSIAELRERLALQLLERPGGDRHASMRTVITDSVASLDEETRRMFAQCAVFRGGFTLAAAEVVLGAASTSSSEPYRGTGGSALLTSLETLADHSLLRLDGARYRFYETIAEVALDQLAALSDRDAYHARHATYFACIPAAERPRDLNNLLAAFAYVTGTVVERRTLVINEDLVLTLVLAIDPVLAARSSTHQRILLLDTALALVSDPPHPFRTALIARGQAHRELGAFVEARLDFTSALTLATQVEDHVVAARAQLGLGELTEINGNTVDARSLYEQGLALVEPTTTAAAQMAVRADAHGLLAHAHRREGDLAATETHLAAATALYRALADREGEARMLYEAAVVALFRKQLAEARTLLEQGLAFAQTLGARPLEAAFDSGLGVLLQEVGELDAAIAHHTRAVQAFRDLGNRHREGSALYYLGGAYLERSEFHEAVAILEEAARVIASVGAHRYAALIHSAWGAALIVGAAATAELSTKARWCFAEADRAAALCESERSLSATLAIHRFNADPRPETRLDAARELVAATTGDDPRFALRVLVLRSKTTEPPRFVNAWSVNTDGTAFRAPGGDLIDLSKRQPLRRIVAALRRHRVEAPGDTLGFDELLAAGWPDERIAQAAALNRLHVALSTLRSLGLRDLLVSGDRGYMFDPAVPVVDGI